MISLNDRMKRARADLLDRREDRTQAARVLHATIDKETAAIDAYAALLREFTEKCTCDAKK